MTSPTLRINAEEEGEAKQERGKLFLHSIDASSIL